MQREKERERERERERRRKREKKNRRKESNHFNVTLAMFGNGSLLLVQGTVSPVQKLSR